MKYSLRSLMIAVLVAPPLLAGGLKIAAKLLEKPNSLGIERAESPKSPPVDDGTLERIGAELDLQIEQLHKEMCEMPDSEAPATNSPKNQPATRRSERGIGSRRRIGSRLRYWLHCLSLIEP